MRHGSGNTAEMTQERASVYFLNGILERFSNNIKGVKMGWIEDEFTRDAFTTEGNITCGWKDAKGDLHRADYFVVGKYPRITRVYGDKPQSLYIEFPVQGKIQEVASLEMVEWGKAGMVRKCNKREMQVFRDDVTDLVQGKKIAREKFGKYPCIAPDCKCKASADIICHILNPETGMPITGLMRIHNGSIRSVNNIKTMLKNVMSYGETPEEQEKMPRCFVWEISVVMRKAKIGKTPTLEIKPVGFKQTRSANNLLKAAGVDAESGGMLMIGEQSSNKVTREEKENGSSTSSSSKNEEQSDPRQENAGMTQGGVITQEDLYAGLRGEEVPAEEAEFEEVNGYTIIRRFERCETEREFMEIMLDYNELNGRNEIGLVELRKCKDLIGGLREEFEKERKDSGSGTGSGRKSEEQEQSSSSSKNEEPDVPKPELRNEGGDGSFEERIRRCGTMEEWGRLLTEFNGIVMEFEEKQRIKTILFNKKQEIGK